MDQQQLRNIIDAEIQKIRESDDPHILVVIPSACPGAGKSTTGDALKKHCDERKDLCFKCVSADKHAAMRDPATGEYKFTPARAHAAHRAEIKRLGALLQEHKEEAPFLVVYLDNTNTVHGNLKQYHAKCKAKGLTSKNMLWLLFSGNVSLEEVEMAKQIIYQSRHHQMTVSDLIDGLKDLYLYEIARMTLMNNLYDCISPEDAKKSLESAVTNLMETPQFEPAPGTCTSEFEKFLRQNTHSVPIDTVAKMLLDVKTLEIPNSPQGATMRKHLGEPVKLNVYRPPSYSNSTHAL